jgi:HEPN domain-containing protein
MLNNKSNETDNKMNETEKIIPLSFLTLGLKYLRLVSNTLEETKKQNNAHLIMSDNMIDEGIYAGLTKWSDFNIIEPVLFNFYHGLELIMKGLLYLCDGSIKATHGLSDQFLEISSKKELAPSLKSILKNHLDIDCMDEMVSTFLKNNRLTIDQLYEVFRYPIDRMFEGFRNYTNLKYREDNSMEYFSRVITDIDDLSRQVVKFYRERE